MKNSKKMSLRIEQQLLQIPKNQHGVPHTLQGMKNQFAIILQYVSEPSEPILRISSTL